MEVGKEKSPDDLIFTGDGFVRRRTLDVKRKQEPTKKQKRKLKDRAKYSEIYFAKEQDKALRHKRWYGK